MTRKSPIKHKVREHDRKGKKVKEHNRGRGEKVNRVIRTLRSSDKVQGRYKDQWGNIRRIPKDWFVNKDFFDSLKVDNEGIMIWPENTYEFRGQTLKFRGEPLDPRIAKTVLLLNHKNFSTVQSCGGHFKGGEYTYATKLPLSEKEKKNRHEWLVTPAGYLKSWIAIKSTKQKLEELKKEFEPLIIKGDIDFMIFPDKERGDYGANLSIQKNTQQQTKETLLHVNRILNEI